MLPPATRGPLFARQTLVACETCGDVFINWTRTAPVCRACGGRDLHAFGIGAP